MNKIEELSNICEIIQNRSFKDYTTIKIGGIIKYLALPKNVEQLQILMNYIQKHQLKFKLLGKGSNVVASDQTYDGVVINLKYFDQYSFQGDQIVAQAGVSIVKLATLAQKAGLKGLEFASGIPGSVAGVTYMNAGAYKSSISDLITEVLVLKENKLVWLKKTELEYAYRHSIFMKHPDWIILEVKMRLVKDDSQKILDIMNDRRNRRINTQPLNLPSCGSCFKNPDNYFVWQLIDGVGLRGYCLNGLEISSKHPNFIVNKGGGRFEDFVALTNLIKEKVAQKFQVDLKLEVEIFKDYE